MSAVISRLKARITRARSPQSNRKPVPTELLPSDTTDFVILAFGTSHSGKSEVLSRICRGGQVKPQDTAIPPTPSDGIRQLHLRHNGLAYRILDIPAGAGPVADLPFRLPHPPHITALIFVADLAGYDQPLPTDASRTALQADIELFDAVSHAPRFGTTPILVFLNRGDEWWRKLDAAPLQDFFPDFQSLGWQEDAMLYLCEKFEGGDRGERGDGYMHITSRGNRDDLPFLVDAVKDIVELKREGVPEG